MESVTIKGTSDGLVITLSEGPLHVVLSQMKTQLSSRASFFLGGRVALRVGDRALSEDQLQEIGNDLQSMGMSLWAVEAEHPATLTAARQLGLETHLRPGESVPVPTPEQISREEMVGIVVRGTLRSGQTIHHAGHVTVIGDVNPGAEVVAGGDIIVWGKLRGIAHAGAMGDDGALVCALQLAPSQIRIGSHIARPPDRGRPPKVAEIATIQDDSIVVERWDKRK
jgi:septum site-determining protein MinC